MATHILPIPPAFYGALQNAQYTFPHETGDGMTDEELRCYWYDRYLFADYCPTREDWIRMRDDPIVSDLIAFFMRCKCMLEHLDFQQCTPAPTFPARVRERIAAQLTDAARIQFTEFMWDMDQIANVTQILLYWRLQGGEGAKRTEEACREWWSAVDALQMERGIPISLGRFRRMPSYFHHVQQLSSHFAPLRERVRKIAMCDVCDVCDMQMENNPPAK